jgi:lysophospholipase L1-like esterase
LNKQKATWGQRILLAILMPVACLVLAEAVIRVFRIDTDLARNKNFEIAVPVWLLSDPNWVRNELSRLKQPRGVKASDVAWLANFEEARYIQFKLKPRINVQADNPFNEIEVRKNVTFRINSNADGFRTHEFTAKKPGTLRIVTLGDSSTFGWGVDPDYTFQNLLEKRLIQSLGREVEVFNLGVSGHTTRHGLGVLRHYAWKLNPDLLIVSFGSNDARYVLQPADKVLAADETWLGGLRWTLMKFKTFRLMRKLILSIFDPFRAMIPKPGQPGKALVHSVPLDQYQNNLRTMIMEARGRHAAVIFMGICAPDDYFKGMKDVAENENVPLVDTKAIFQDSLEKLRSGLLYPDEVRFAQNIYGEEAMAKNWWLYVSSDGCHPNRAGTSLLADALAPIVEQALASRSAER